MLIWTQTCVRSDTCDSSYSAPGRAGSAPFWARLGGATASEPLRPGRVLPVRSRWLNRSVQGAVILASLGACAVESGSTPAESPLGQIANDTGVKSLIERARALAEDSKSLPVRGPNGWLFLPIELRSLDGSHVGEARSLPDRQQAERAISFARIVEFARELEDRGIRILVVPVPQKVAVYPEEAIPEAEPGAPRLDVVAQEVFLRLSAEKINYVDLYPLFRKEKSSSLDDPLYVPTDTHWSSRGCLVAAREIARRARTILPDLEDANSTRRGSVVPALAPVDGDLGRLLQDAGVNQASIQMWFHRAPAPDWNDPSPPSGPLVLLGDSHLLVWRSERAGLNDLLAQEVGRAIPQIAVQVGGPKASVEAVKRRPEILSEARLVLWVFASRFIVTDEIWDQRPSN